MHGGAATTSMRTPRPEAARASTGDPSRVDGLARLEHLDELRQPPGARLRLLRVLEPVEDRVPVLAAQLGEERLGLGARVELALEVVGHGDALLALVGR